MQSFLMKLPNTVVIALVTYEGKPRRFNSTLSVGGSVPSHDMPDMDVLLKIDANDRANSSD